MARIFQLLSILDWAASISLFLLCRYAARKTLYRIEFSSTYTRISLTFWYYLVSAVITEYFTPIRIALVWGAVRDTPFGAELIMRLFGVTFVIMVMVPLGVNAILRHQDSKNRTIYKT